jgi:o-succinylbenzoate---CoA ligase
MILINNKEHWLIQQVSRIPKRTALVNYERIITYRQLNDESMQYANIIYSLGVRSKDHVGILFGHNVNFFKVINALWFIGAVPVLLSTRDTDSEIKIKLKQADIKFLLIDEALEQQYSSIQFQKKILCNNEKILNLKISRYNRVPCPFKANSPALILFTSGSSGRPKAVVHTFNSLFESVKATDSFAGLSQKDLWLAGLPLYHIGGFMILCRSLVTGSAAALPESVGHEHFVNGLKHFNPSHISFVPTTLFKLVNENTAPNKNLKYAFLGGGPSEAQLSLDAFVKGWPVVKVYGSSETCSMVTALHPRNLILKAAFSGKPLYKNKIKIKYAGKRADSGAGEIFIQTPSLLKYYYDKKHTTKINKTNKWFSTGDLGWLNNDGYLFVETRREEIIISGGENVSAKEVESAFKLIPGIKDAYVFPTEDKKWGQIVCAAIVGKGISEKEIKGYLKDKISGYKIPKKIFFLNNIPKNEMGKVNREILLKKISPD